MIYIKLINHDYRYEVSEFLKLFSSEFSFLDSSEVFGVVEEDNEFMINSLEIDYDLNEVTISSTTKVYKNNKEIYQCTQKGIVENSKYKIKTLSKRLIHRSMFGYLNDRFDANVPWGILVGIRPVKLVHKMMDEGMSDSEILNFMKREYLVDDDKILLMLDIAKRERTFIYPISDKKVSLYVSIPFCPTRCLYCSFPSHILSKYGDMRDEYIKKLLLEARAVADILENTGRKIETVYIGGGTPTSLDAKQLDILISELKSIFDLSNILEFTVEAGRPDTITREKLEVIKSHNVDRISINPQTMNQNTLDIIGRKHTVDEIIKCFNLAREIGFDNINMDLILGLPKETPEDVEHTISEILKLSPESVTVHTLALKRSSDLNINIEKYKSEMTDYKSLVSMIDISKTMLENNGYNPYYMYRQKHMLGNLENIGYSKPGKECIYNMQMMEDKQSNIAIGAGAVTKVVYLEENRIERVDDVKNLEVYLERIDDMIEKKKKYFLKESEIRG